MRQVTPSGSAPNKVAAQRVITRAKKFFALRSALEERHRPLCNRRWLGTVRPKTVLITRRWKRHRLV